MSLSQTRLGANATGLPGPAPLPLLSAALSRRAALFGAVTVAGVSAAVAGPAAHAAITPSRAPTASAAPPVSAEARALQEEAGRLSREYRTACREADQAGGLVDYPDPPEALYAQVRDYRLFARNPTPSWSDKGRGRHWWAEPETVEGLRGASFRNMGGRTDEQAAARRDEIVAAYDRWQAEDKAAEDAAGLTAANERFEAAHHAYAAFRLRLAEMRTADPEVLTVKALVIRDLCPDAERFDRLLSGAIGRDSGAYETAMAMWLARDFLALMGADLRGQA